jgi:hypothetical protein
MSWGLPSITLNRTWLAPPSSLSLRLRGFPSIPRWLGHRVTWRSVDCESQIDHVLSDFPRVHRVRGAFVETFPTDHKLLLVELGQYGARPVPPPRTPATPPRDRWLLHTHQRADGGEVPGGPGRGSGGAAAWGRPTVGVGTAHAGPLHRRQRAAPRSHRVSCIDHFILQGFMEMTSLPSCPWRGAGDGTTFVCCLQSNFVRRPWEKSSLYPATTDWILIE